MPEFYYSPHTGEVINTSTPADWMGKTHIAPPLVNPVNQGAFFREGAWVVETAQPAAAPVPQQVTNAQGTAVLIQVGLWPQVLAYVSAIQDPVQKALAEVALNKTTHWQRNSPFLNTAAAALGITQEQMDELFIAADQVML